MGYPWGTARDYCCPQQVEAGWVVLCVWLGQAFGAKRGWDCQPMGLSWISQGPEGHLLLEDI